MNRRNFIKTLSAGLIIPAAPVIVKASSLMPVRMVEPSRTQFGSLEEWLEAYRADPYDNSVGEMQMLYAGSIAIHDNIVRQPITWLTDTILWHEIQHPKGITP